MVAPAGLGAALLLLSLAALDARGDALGTVERMVAWRYPVAQIDVAELAARRGDSRPWLFDVRREDEFAVSHLPGAVRLPPDTDAAAFLQTYRKRLHGRSVVFYCTVGARSSRLAWALRDRLTDTDAITVYNLRGGILRWQAANLSLENASGATTWVHPYDRLWARLAARPDRLSTVPRNDAPAVPP